MLFERNISIIEQLPLVAKELLEEFKGEKLFLFEAQMGNGKTTFIKELCKQLGATNSLSSPTYSIVNEYQSPNGKIFHFDLYRLKNANELLDIGFEDYLDGKSYCFIEWPQIAMAFLKNEPHVAVQIDLTDNTRLLKAEKHS
jgi:tRNA threonylcarbamoyladenosine biosynthesis protein TsaE